MRNLLAALLLPVTALAADAVLIDRIVAVVDLHAITRHDVETRARELVPPGSDAAKLARAREAALTALIEDHLIAEDAEKAGVTVEAEDVDRALQSIAEINHLSLEQLLAEAKQDGLEKDVYRAAVRRQLVEMKWVRLRASQTKQPKEPAEYAAFMAKERTRLLAELKAKASIEVRP
ncbi:MAG: hypothetical protein AMXMBFR34_24900 [Myxococcaceae bacterium]